MGNKIFQAPHFNPRLVRVSKRTFTCRTPLKGNFFHFPIWVKNGIFLGYICDFNGNFTNWENSTKSNRRFGKTPQNPKNGIVLTQYNLKNGI